MENKRLFFGFEIASPWPDEMPPGRILLEKDRHLTVAFLGNADLSELLDGLAGFPALPFRIGLSGIFDRPIFLPSSFPRVAAWGIKWLEGENLFNQFQKDLIAWLKKMGLHPKEHAGELFSHVTMARNPSALDKWKESFEKRPLFIRSLHLCESLGSSHYQVRWKHPLLSPFDEKEHTADIAFTVRGTSLQNLYLHAQLALSFHFPQLLDYFSFEKVLSFDKIVEGLNRIIGKADEKIGSPFKAVSYHGSLKGEEILEWEMIVDV